MLGNPVNLPIRPGNVLAAPKPGGSRPTVPGSVFALPKPGGRRPTMPGSVFALPKPGGSRPTVPGSVFALPKPGGSRPTVPGSVFAPTVLPGTWPIGGVIPLVPLPPTVPTLDGSVVSVALRPGSPGLTPPNDRPPALRLLLCEPLPVSRAEDIQSRRLLTILHSSAIACVHNKQLSPIIHTFIAREPPYPLSEPRLS